MQLKLVIEHDAGITPPQEFTLTNEETLIGRSVTSDLVLPDETCVISRKHAKIKVEGERYYLIDLGSHNRSYLNNRAVEAEVPHPLHFGDILQIGRYRLEVQSVSKPDEKDVLKDLGIMHLHGDSLPVSRKIVEQEIADAEVGQEALSEQDMPMSEFKETKPLLAFQEKEVLEHSGDGHVNEPTVPKDESFLYKVKEELPSVEDRTPQIEKVQSIPEQADSIQAKLDGDASAQPQSRIAPKVQEVNPSPQIVWGAEEDELHNFQPKIETEEDVVEGKYPHISIEDDLEEDMKDDMEDIIEDELEDDVEDYVEPEMMDWEEDQEFIGQLDEPISSEEHIVESNPFMVYAGELRRILATMQELYDEEKSLERHIDLVDALSEGLRGQKETLVGLAVLAALKKK